MNVDWEAAGKNKALPLEPLYGMKSVSLDLLSTVILAALLVAVVSQPSAGFFEKKGHEASTLGTPQPHVIESDEPKTSSNFRLVSHSFCRDVRKPDNGTKSCVGESKVFAKSTRGINSLLTLRNVTEGGEIRWKWTTSSQEFEGKLTYGPGEIVQPHMWLAVPDNADEIRVEIYINDDKVLLETVSLTAAPTASFEYSPHNPVATNLVRFDASASQDPDGTIEKYAWDFTGDREIDRTGSSVTWRFPNDKSNYSVELTVTDNQGVSETERRRVDVNLRPTAAFEVLGQPLESSKLRVNAKASEDPDGRIVSYQWDFGSTGAIDAEGDTTSIRPEDPGTLNITLTVTDEEGVSDTVKQSITIAADTDGDGLSDEHERKLGTNPNLSDTDGDGLTDPEEVNEYSTDPTKSDTDGDGLTDYEEVKRFPTNPTQADTDGDGLTDSQELREYPSDPINPDTDGDGLLDGDEVIEYNTSPVQKDTDGDGLNDQRELELGTNPKAEDTDGDGIEDRRELALDTDPTAKDTDSDGLIDDRELKLGTDPTAKNTDGDGLTDGTEVELGTNPKKADTDGDGLDDDVEINRKGTNPTARDTDNDYIKDGIDPYPTNAYLPAAIPPILVLSGILVHYREICIQAFRTVVLLRP